MTVKELIEKLNHCSHGEAVVHIVYGTEGSAVDDIFDRTDFKILPNHPDSGYQDIFVSEMETKAKTYLVKYYYNSAVEATNEDEAYEKAVELFANDYGIVADMEIEITEEVKIKRQ